MDPPEQTLSGSGEGSRLLQPLKWGEADVNDAREGSTFILPVGTVTFLMTDVEGSSRLWEAGDAPMATSIARHNAIIDESVGRRGGVRPMEQGEGDSSLAAFARASDAIECALDLQRAFGSQDWGDGPELRIRIALHTGDAQLRDEANYFGQTVNRCARLRAIAHGGQILLSRSTYELVADRLPAGARVKDLGVHRLKDLARPEHVWQLSHPDLQEDFPPPRSLEVLPNNLPIQLTTFIGREVEIEKVHALLRTSRIVTLTGAGGVGKTRLALQTGAEMLDEFADGVWWADLGSTEDAALVPSVLATTFSVRESPMAPLVETLKKHLIEKRVLVLLDNCEHVISAGAQLVETLLRSCPGLVVLATSREPLGVEGEVTFRVPSLSLPEPNERQQIDAITQYEGVRLFIDRALRARPNFEVNNDNAPAVAEICQRLEGIPLAIELAAARVRLLTADQIASGLTDRFHLLTGGARTALPRQQTLRASVDWSYELLSEEERLLLMRLSVFAGGFSLDAVEEVCEGGGIERRRILDLVSSLVDKSLVVVEDEGRLAHYRLLETVRHYGRERLRESGMEAETRDSHLDFFVGMAEKSLIGFEGESVVTWLDWVEREADNLRAAMEWSFRSSSPSKGLQLVTGIADAWTQRLHASEILRWFDTALATPDLDPRLRAEGLLRASWASFQPGVGPAFAREAIEIAREIGDERLLGRSLCCLGWQDFFFDPPNARPSLEEALQLSRRQGDSQNVVAALSMLGSVEFRAGKAASARPLLEEALSVAREHGRRFDTQHVLASLGYGLAVQAEFEDAKSALSESVHLSRELGILGWILNPLSWLGLIEIRRGNYEEARGVLEEALSVAQEVDLPGITPIWFLGTLHYARGDYESALTNFERALQGHRAWGFGAATSQTLVEIARAKLCTGDAASARAHLDEAEALAREAENPYALALALEARSELAREEGQLDDAERLVHDAMTAATEAGARVALIDSLEYTAGIIGAQGRFDEATRLFGAADAAREATGTVRFASHQEAYEADLATVRAGLGEEAFVAAWQEGRAMSLDEAFAYSSRGWGARKRPSTGWASLTPTELDVVKLVAQGLSNPDIAKRLFITRSTVKTHLSHVFEKLGVTSRSELAAEASRRGF